MSIVHIGCGAGFSGDRFDAAGPVVADLMGRDGPRYLMFEVLAERTLAVAQRLKLDDPNAGYSPFLDKYLAPILADCLSNQIRIVSNLGAANPLGAARRVQAMAAEMGIRAPKIAVLIGDDLRAYMDSDEIAAFPTMEGLEIEGRPILSANVYLGGRDVAAALAEDPDIVLVGRTTDSALALGPLIHEFGWREDALDRLAAGTLCGHLLECGAQVTGAYFADPGFKDTPDLWRVGFPIGEASADGDIVITKAAQTGGMVTRATVTEQILYEMHDPGAYLTPDVMLDVTELELVEAGPDRVRATGARGRPPPETLKATICMDGGWLGEAEMTYAGANALARAELAGEVVRERLGAEGMNEPLRVDILGTGAVHDGGDPERRGARRLAFDGEYRVRVAARSVDRARAAQVIDELQSLYCSGPAAGGGFRQHLTPEISTASVLIPRERVAPHVRVEMVA